MDDAYLDAVSESGSPKTAALDDGLEKIEAPWGIMQCEVGPDARRAVLRSVISKDDSKPVKPEQMLEALQNHGFSHGIRAEALVEVSQAAHGPAGWQGQVEFARATEPSGAVRLTYPCAENLGVLKQSPGKWQIGETVVVFADVVATLRADTSATIASSSASGLAVSPGQILIELDGISDLKTGTNVYGGVIEAEIALGPEPGENVNVTNDGARFESQIFGYVALREGRLSVLPPIWLDPKQMETRYVYLPGPGPRVAPGKPDLLDALSRLGVASGVLEQNIDQLCTYLSLGKDVRRSVVIARGRPPYPVRTPIWRLSLRSKSVLEKC